MKALVFDNELRIEDQPKPVASGRECLVRVLKAGICNTDLEITKGISVSLECWDMNSWA